MVFNATFNNISAISWQSLTEVFFNNLRCWLLFTVIDCVTCHCLCIKWHINQNYTEWRVNGQNYFLRKLPSKNIINQSINDDWNYWSYKNYQSYNEDIFSLGISSFSLFDINFFGGVGLSEHQSKLTELNELGKKKFRYQFKNWEIKEAQ